MTKGMRKIIRIDESKCDGCGACLPGCPEGALQIVDGKVRLVRESYCDGLGACLGHCPQGALQVEERAADNYDAVGVLAHLEAQSPELAERHRRHMREHGLELPGEGPGRPVKGCPSVQEKYWSVESSGGQGAAGGISALGHWPVKLRLISPAAEFLKNCDLVLVADCVPFAYGNMHNDFIKGKVVAAGCPKFDEVEAYGEKIQQLLESVNIRSIAVVYMEIPCCRGFARIVKEALERSGSNIPLETVQIGIKGEIIKREVLTQD
ncbi:MAG: ATP-binding protein [Bacillota bacterium]